MPEIKHKVQLRNGFSDRNNIEKINKQIQLIDFDKRTRNAILNLFHDWIFNRYNDSILNAFLKKLVSNVFSEYLSPNIKYEIDCYPENIFNEYIYKTVMSGNYDEVLTLIEFIVQIYEEYAPYRKDLLNCEYKYDYIKDINELLEQEFVGYRYVGNYIVAITDNVELNEIKETLSSKFQGCKKQISKALGFIADRDKPDYKNSIKESISAVESVCQIITNNPKATLGDAINLLDKNGIQIHKAMKEAFKKLYGYTSEQGGIRHSEGMFESNVTFDDAKYMLVSCCAFVNYLIVKYDKIHREENER